MSLVGDIEQTPEGMLEPIDGLDVRSECIIALQSQEEHRRSKLFTGTWRLGFFILTSFFLGRSECTGQSSGMDALVRHMAFPVDEVVNG